MPGSQAKVVADRLGSFGRRIGTVAEGALDFHSSHPALENDDSPHTKLTRAGIRWDVPRRGESALVETCVRRNWARRSCG